MKYIGRQIVCVGAIVLAVIMVACTAPGAPVTLAVTTPVELTYVSFTDDSTLADPVGDELIRQFEAAHPNITISRSTAHVEDNPPQAYLADAQPPDILAMVADYLTATSQDLGRISGRGRYVAGQRRSTDRPGLV